MPQSICVLVDLHEVFAFQCFVRSYWLMFKRMFTRIAKNIFLTIQINLDFVSTHDKSTSKKTHSND